jgi:hydrogenase maturation protease
MHETPRTTVIGLGNPIMGDDGFGLAAMRHLVECWVVPDNVTIVEGGTWGLTLLPIIEESDRVLLLDAIRAGTEPGTVVRVSGADLTRVYGARVSPHQVDLTDVLALAAWRGTLPDAVVAIGAEPAMIDLAATLSPVVHAAIERAVDAAAVQLGEWGHVCERRGPAREDTTAGDQLPGTNDAGGTDVANCPDRAGHRASAGPRRCGAAGCHDR